VWLMDILRILGVLKIPHGTVCVQRILCVFFSVKFVGVFTMVLIGVSTVAELWQLLSDLSTPVVLLTHQPSFTGFWRL